MFNNSCVPLMMNVEPAGYSNNNGGNGMWGDGAWWIIILLIFAWGGFGNGFGGGYGGGNAQQGYDTRADLQRGFDTQATTAKLNGLENGLCDGFYNVNTTLMNGFHGVDSAICNLGYQVQNGFNQTNVALMQSQNTLSSQLANCCCENREAISQVRYDMATQACDTRNTIQNATRDIIDGQNAGTRAILDFLTQDKIATLTAENQSLKFAQSQAAQTANFNTLQEAQTAELIRRLGRDVPVPAYMVPNPNCCYTPNQLYGGFGNNGCGGCC